MQQQQERQQWHHQEHHNPNTETSAAFRSGPHRNAKCLAKENCRRSWTPENLVQRLGDWKFTCGVDNAGDDVVLSLQTYAKYYATGHGRATESKHLKAPDTGVHVGRELDVPMQKNTVDRNPMVLFDATVIEVLHAESALAKQVSKRVHCPTILFNIDADTVAPSLTVCIGNDCEKPHKQIMWHMAGPAPACVSRH